MADTKQLQSPDALKARFKAGSIPLQSDFADLIDLANAGAVAAGQAASQDNNAGLGMIYDSTGKLALNVYRTYDFNSSNDLSDCMPISVDTSNNWPVVDLSYGLKGSSNGLTVVASTGIVVNANGVSVASDTMAYVEAAARGVGKFHGQDGKAGVGMRYSADGKLEPNLESHDYDGSEAGVLPLKIDSSTNMMVVDLDQGLVASDDGLSVKAATGIVVNANGVNVAPDTMAYVEAAARGVGKFHGQDGKAGIGMRYSADGKLELNVDKSNFDYSSEDDGSVFIAVDKGTNKPVLDLGPGLTSATSDVEVRVKASTGIKVGTDGVSVDMAYVVPKGIIVMFSGSAAPTGWVFCDGTNSTPDLRDRFIKGSQTISASTGGQGSLNYVSSGTTVALQYYALAFIMKT